MTLSTGHKETKRIAGEHIYVSILESLDEAEKYVERHNLPTLHKTDQDTPMQAGSMLIIRTFETMATEKTRTRWLHCSVPLSI